MNMLGQSLGRGSAILYSKLWNDFICRLEYGIYEQRTTMMNYANILGNYSYGRLTYNKLDESFRN